MTNKELEFIDLTNKQYEELINKQIKAYKHVLHHYKDSINDPEKMKFIDEKISEIDYRILSELEEIKVYNKIFMEAVNNQKLV